MEVLLGRAVIVLAVLYTSAVGYLKIRETSLVYPGAGRTFRMVPDRQYTARWDTMRVVAADSVRVLLMETRVDDAPDRPWVLFLHGNFGLLGARGNVARYRVLHEAGFNVLAVEYRGFGGSNDAGKPTEKGINADAAAGWQYLTGERGVPPERVVIYGYSLGAGPATYLAETFEAGALVTEGGATSLPDVGAGRYPWVPVRLIMSNKFKSLARAPALTERWVIFHGRRDEVIPFVHGERLSAAAPSARFVPLEADHDGGVVEDRRTAVPVLIRLARSMAIAAESPGRPANTPE